MSIYASKYKQADLNRTVEEYAINPNDIRLDEGVISNFVDVLAVSAEETFKTTSVLAESLNEREYWTNNDDILSNYIKNQNTNIRDEAKENLENLYSTYKSLNFQEYTRIKDQIRSGFLESKQGEKENKLIEQAKAVKQFEEFVEANPQLKLQTKENIRKEVTKDIENLRQKRQTRIEQQDSIIGEFLGDTIGFLGDPVNLASMFIPLGGQIRGASLLTRSLDVGRKTAIIEAGIEGFNQINTVMPYRSEYLGDNYTEIDALGAVATTAFGSFLLGGSINALGEGAKYLMRGDKRSNIEALTEETQKRYSENPSSFDAEQIEAKRAVELLNSKSTLAPDEFQAQNLKAFDKAAQDLALGQKVDVSGINEEMVRKAYVKMVDDISASKNLKMAKQKLGKEAVSYIKKNAEQVKKDILEANVPKTVFQEMGSKLTTKLDLAQDVGQEAFKESTSLIKKANNELVKEGYNKEVLDELNINLGKVEGNLSSINTKLADDMAGDIIDSVDNIKKATKEQEVMEELTQCLIGAPNVKTN